MTVINRIKEADIEISAVAHFIMHMRKCIAKRKSTSGSKILSFSPMVIFLAVFYDQPVSSDDHFIIHQSNL
jgi:hypothetical protein